MFESWIMLSPPPIRPALAAVQVVVSRSIGRPVAVTAPQLRALGRTAVPLGDGASLTFDDALTPRDRADGTWVARARLARPRSRPWHRCRVEVTLSPWSADACELSLRPVARSPHRWGAGRARRYFEVAHRAADALAADLYPAPAAAGAAGRSRPRYEEGAAA